MDALMKCLFVYGIAAIVSIAVAAVIHLTGFLIKKFAAEQAPGYEKAAAEEAPADEAAEIAVAVAVAMSKN